jgi:hypothetical protein
MSSHPIADASTASIEQITPNTSRSRTAFGNKKPVIQIAPMSINYDWIGSTLVMTRLGHPNVKKGSEGPWSPRSLAANGDLTTDLPHRSPLHWHAR